MDKLVEVEILRLNRLTEPIDVAYDCQLNEHLTLELNDVVLVGWTDTDELRIGIVKQKPVSVKSSISAMPVIVTRIDWPSKPLRELVAKFKLDQLFEAANGY